jgi:hypothetical protein
MRSATNAAFSPNHNATPVQTNVAMMRPPAIIGRAYALIWQGWRRPDQYGAQHEYCACGIAACECCDAFFVGDNT